MASTDDFPLKVKLPNEATTVILVSKGLSIWEVIQKICEKKTLVAGDYSLQIVIGDSGKHKDVDEGEIIGSFDPVPTDVILVKKPGVGETIQNARPRASGGRRPSVVLAPHPHQAQRMLSTEFPKTITDVNELDKKLHGPAGSRPDMSGTIRNKAAKAGKSLMMNIFATKRSGADLLDGEEGGTPIFETSSSTLAFSQLGSIDEERKKSDWALGSATLDRSMVAPWEKNVIEKSSDKTLVAPWERQTPPPAADSTLRRQSDKTDSDVETLASYEGRGHFLNPEPVVADANSSMQSINRVIESGSMSSIAYPNAAPDASTTSLPGTGLSASGQMGSFMSLQNGLLGSRADPMNASFASLQHTPPAAVNTSEPEFPPPITTGMPRSDSTGSSAAASGTLGREKIRKRTISSPSTSSTDSASAVSPYPKDTTGMAPSSSSTLRRNTFRHANRPRSLDTPVDQANIGSSTELETSSISLAFNPASSPHTPTTPVNENDRRLPLRVTLPNLLSTVIKVPPEKTMDFILEYTCNKKGLDYNSHTLEFPNKPPVEIDRMLGQYAQEFGGGMLEVFVVKKQKSFNAVISEEGKDVCILKITEGSVQVMAATAEKLIERLTDPDGAVDTIFVDTMLLTYRNFMKPHDFFDRLLDRFNCEPPPDPTPEDVAYFNQMKEPTQRRVLHIFKWWVEHHYHDFGVDHSLKTDLEDFANQVETYHDADFREDASDLREAIDKQSQLYEQMFDAYRAAERRGKQLESMFQEISPEDVAHQIAVHNHKMFRNIHPIEILNEIWKMDQESSPSLKQFVGRFDTESFWVATEICGVKDLKKRILVLKKFIQVAKICVEVNNFFSLFSIVSGLNMGPVSRLKKTWEGLGDKHKKMWTDLEQLTDPMRNWKKLRDHLATVSPPMVPLLPMYLKDLIFMNDGNESKVRGMINFDKLRMMATRVKDIANLVAIEYPHQPIPPIQNYLAKPVVERSHAKLKEMSVECEKS